ncbi:hypothetical protein [Dactylosporangium sp. CS-033363]|uniref:hypothetical protein n=1 Tax=Dactylosporangium sp. CS-033363 TaxID=3239935 RepID=UPI003D8B7980
MTDARAPEERTEKPEPAATDEGDVSDARPPEESIATPEPAATDEGDVTDAPAPEEPVATPEPAATDEGHVTDAPAPEEPVATPEPAATEAIVEHEDKTGDDDAVERDDEPVPVVAEPEVRRSRRRIAVAAAVLAIALVAAGGVLVWRVLTPNPRSVAQEYFGRLAAGDATGALRTIDKASLAADLPTAAPLLSDAALRDPALRPQDMSINKVTEAGDTATMEVQYRAGGSTVTQTLKAQRQGRRYLLEAPLVRLVIPGTGAARVTVNGIDVDPAKGGPAFPGAFAVAVEGTVLFNARTAQAVPGPAGAATVNLGAPSLSADGQAKADAAIKAALELCAKQHFEPQPTCPEIDLFQRGDFVPVEPPADAEPVEIPAGATVTMLAADIKVALAKAPACTYTVDAGERVAFTCADGVAHWDMKLVRQDDGTTVATNAGDTPVAPKGHVELTSDGQLKVSFA